VSGKVVSKEAGKVSGFWLLVSRKKARESYGTNCQLSIGNHQLIA
jgi:hypothetical protein